ncbi:MAG TPA: nitroreductase family protein [Candidatus Binataceae bacterium]|nr:nitroreductase family protein [Candidatus Binataceae bacterium]
MAEIGVFEAIHSARALRRFRPDPVPDELLTRVLDAAVRAPSASSGQNWLFAIVKDPAVRARLGEIYRESSRVVQAEYAERGKPQYLGDRQYELMRKSSNYLFEHLADAPVVIVAALRLGAVGSRHSPLHGEQEQARYWRLSGASIYPAVQNLMLACRAVGLGTVLTTIHAYYEEQVKAALNLPADVHSYALMPVGWPLDKFGPVKRRPLSEVAFRDRWGNPWVG